MKDPQGARRSVPGVLADEAQLAGHVVSNHEVAGSIPVIRSTALCPNGQGTVCKTVHTGSIPVSASQSPFV